MTERCNAIVGKSQCRKTTRLTRVIISIVRLEGFAAKLPAEAVIRLCPRCLRLSVFERMCMETK